MAEAEEDRRLEYCSAPPRTMPNLPPDMPLARQRAIIVNRSKWANGTQLHYTFLHGAPAQADVVREAFQEWKEIGIGLSFVEVDSPAEAEVRIGFVQGDGSWSYLGRDVLLQGQNERTMNFGWNLRSDHGRSTAFHEIGHTIGLPHEHQNPNAGIVWNEEAVYQYLGGPPNNWPRETVYHNVLRKLSPAEVEGSDWDPDSIMEYEFPSGLVRSPEAYRKGIFPPGTISKIDKEQVLMWYPALEAQVPRLKAFQSAALNLASGQQFNAEIVPDASRPYQIGTFGATDVVLVLFEDIGDGELRYLAGDDDSGEERNALIRIKLFAGRRYVARVRMQYAKDSGASALMYW
ncbi:M12 family metallopeptidase [Actinoplanes sp. NPDC026670]|uniref:M12 family metallopeptidase n=1 Tax=Actinoplanes sp. NPDC026670 TaxID=3154700 RepID=UPI0034068F2A